MTPDQWALTERLYHEAGPIAISERGSWLVRACGGDEVVRREVESLLAQDASMTGAFDGHALDQIAPETEESLIGRRIGGYEFLSLIDQGGMGQVYRARDLTLPRDVAVKVVSPQFTHDAVRRARFRQEAEVLATFAHPHIAHIYTFGEAEGRFLLAMELVPGETLAARISRGPLRLNDALDIARQVAEALEAAHEQGVVHRDLKPANIRITPEGVVKVLDFGLATTARSVPAATSADITRTTPGTLLGTVAYMSPEQARGETVDKRTDIWAFGCVLFEMLTGAKLFGRASTAETLALVITKEIDWSALPVHTPTVVRALLRRCLERDQRKRVGDVAAIRFALEEASRPGLADARAREPADDVAREATGRQAPVHLLIGSLKRHRILAFVTVLLAGVLAIWMANRRGEAQAVTVLLPPGFRLTSTGNAILPALSPDANEVAYVERGDEGDRLLIRQSTGAGNIITLAGQPGVRILAVTFTPDGQSVDYVTDESARHDLKRVPSTGGESRLLIEGGVDSAIAWSPDGRQFAFLRLEQDRVDETSLMLGETDGINVTVRPLSRQIVVGDVGRKFVTFQLSRDGGPAAPAWSPNGATIAVSAWKYPQRTGLIMFVTVSNGSVNEVPANLGAGGAWLDDATLLWSMIGGAGQPPQLYTVSTSGRSERLTTDLSHYGTVSLSGQRKAFVTAQVDSETTISIRDATQRGVAEYLDTSAAPPLGGFVSQLTWAGDRLLYEARSGERRGLWEADTVVNRGDAVRELLHNARLPSASADGDAIIYVTPGRPNTLWRANRDGRNVTKVATDVVWPVMQPEGRLAVFVRMAADGAVRLWRVALAEGTVEEIAGVQGTSPDISSDGRWLAFASNHKGPEGSGHSVVAYCELQNCSSTVRYLPAPRLRSGATPIRWTPDGTGVAYINAAGAENIWIQPLEGNEKRQLTRFTDGATIRNFAWSRDQRLAILRERTKTDIVVYKELAFAAGRH